MHEQEQQVYGGGSQEPQFKNLQPLPEDKQDMLQKQYDEQGVNDEEEQGGADGISWSLDSTAGAAEAAFMASGASGADTVTASGANSIGRPTGASVGVKATRGLRRRVIR